MSYGCYNRCYPKISQNKLTPAITAIVLAGGESRRMGTFDKALLQWPPSSSSPQLSTEFTQSLLWHCLKRAKAQVPHVIVSSNQPLQPCVEAGYSVVADLTRFERQGPLAGLVSAADHVESEWLCVLPVDTPYLPVNWVAELWAGLDANSQIAVAHDGERQQNALLLMHRSVLSSVERALSSGRRSIHAWLQGQTPATVYFQDCGHAFANINSPADWAAAADRQRLNQPTS